MPAFISAVLTLLPYAFEYGLPIVNLVERLVAVFKGSPVTDADWQAVHDLRDKADVVRKKREADARAELAKRAGK